MSSSDQDMSDTSNIESPHSHRTDSPYSSPSQQVPQLANVLNVLSCGDNYNKSNLGPFLRILEQPQDHFRFRYRSEMIGTHGCLLGKSSNSSKTKTHPCVELVNFKGKALIRCRLAQVNNELEHPHKLLEDDQDRDVSAEVPEGGSYKVGFGGMGIIHTAKKDVPSLLFKKYAATAQNINEKELRLHCENLAKSINLNIVRLRFSAHDLDTDQEICPPVFSEPIHNMKSAATNDLKICRISRCSGGPRGGDDVFILVEKVNKKNIKIRFFELGLNGEEVWSAEGAFLQTDVHHQYAIVFRTPKYRDLQITHDVNVFVELLRPSDGRTSEPRDFTYKADPVYRQNKKRKANSSYSSIDSGGSLISIDLPLATQPVNNTNKNMDMGAVKPEQMLEIEYTDNIPRVPQASSTPENYMAQALLHDLSGSVTLFPPPAPQPPPSQMQYNTEQPIQNNSIGPPVLQLDSTEMESILKGSIPPEEREQFENFTHDFLKSFDSFPLNRMTMFTSDSGRAKDTKTPSSQNAKTSTSEEDRLNKNTEYTAFYTAEHGIEVKKLVKELCEIIRNKTGYKKQTVKEKLERLFEMRLSNGDTFLHMTLCSNQSSLEYIVKLIHSMRMTHLLNLRNHRLRTILHVAVKNDAPKLVSFLVSKGCDPMAEDNEGNNAIHYAVKYQTCLVALLDAIRDNNVPYDINAYNNEKQTPLHVAAVHWAGGAVRELAARGARTHARDAAARTALHLAAYDDALPVVRALLHYMPPDEVDLVDGQGNTALQIVCSGDQKENSLEILKLLLDHKADPLKHEEFNKPAWKLCNNKPAMWEVMQQYVSYKTLREDDMDIKSEPEDEYESADEGDSPAGTDAANYMQQITSMLDLSGGWRALAARADKGTLLPVFAAAVSPTRALIDHMMRCDDTMTPATLAAALDSIGQAEAAKIIRDHIPDLTRLPQKTKQ